MGKMVYKIFDGYSIAFICFIQWGIATMGIKVGLKSKGEEDLRRGLVCIRTKEYELSIPPFTASNFFQGQFSEKTARIFPAMRQPRWHHPIAVATRLVKFSFNTVFDFTKIVFLFYER